MADSKYTADAPPPQYLIYPSFTTSLTEESWKTYLKIPSSFTLLYGRVLALSGPQMSLTTCYGSWLVKKDIVEDQPSKQGLTAGLSEFIAGNDIDKGDQVSFFFTGISSFTVALFNSHGCSKNILHAMSYISQLAAKCQHPPTAQPHHTPFKKPTSKVTPMNLFSPPSAPHAPPLTIHQHHCIDQVIALTKNRRYNMSIPTQFFRAAGLHMMESVLLSNAAGGKWIIKLGRCRLGSGWTPFWKANKLQIGDTILL